MTSALHISNLSIDYVTGSRELRALEDVSLTIEEGEIVGLIGESGAGKSTLAHAATRLIAENAQIVNGSICVAGRDIVRANDAELEDLRGAIAATVFQEPMRALNPVLRIRRQIFEVLSRRGVASSDIPSAAGDILRAVGLDDTARILSAFPHMLSGGMCQRVLLAMALQGRPRLLICDEPTTALDVTIQEQILLLIRQRASELGVAVLFVSHDLAVVAQLCTRIYVLYAGRVVEWGDTEKLIHAPRHPYTQALLDALPDARIAKEPLRAIPGNPPSDSELTTGCSFRPRCAHAFEKCLVEPILQQTHTGTSAACWLHDQAADT